ncbi:O-antigen ligase [Halomonas citrativorans]|uniref:O-antigen ligase n=1 Tax=Halomonas citrativorans TaxID=2742612 RepID=A0A1R4HX55_9GAMM|nr:O-antigen ligase family protein [Halomonas citrativorans]SJN12171.1 O-antigen ligase [Halomonas citrativorans]
MVVTKPLNQVTSGIVFLMGALALIVPSGYSIGPVMLLLLSGLLLVKPLPYKLAPRDLWVIAALSSYGLVVGMFSLLELSTRELDRPVRFLLAVPVLLLILRVPPRLSWLWSGIAVGAIGAGTLAAWQKLIEDVGRADGFLHPIQFGNLSMLLGVLCLAGLGWAAVQRFRYTWMALLLTGALCGMLGSLFSGSRGGWVGLPIIGLVLYRSYGHCFSVRVKLSMVGFVTLLLAALYMLPEVGLQKRVHEAVSDISSYVTGEERDTSLGLRFEMWQGATQLIAERPLLGWGEAGYQAAMHKLGEEGDISLAASTFDHAHNDIIDAFAKRGVFGVAALLCLYLVPLRMFASGLQHSNLEIRALAVAGTLLSVAYIDFGLSQTFFAHNSGAMFYAFWLAVLWGVYSAQSRATRDERHSCST